MPEWPEVLYRAGITPSVVVFAGAFIVVLIYLFFFQQIVTALFYKFALRCLLPKGLSVKFERFSFSMFTGQFTIHRLEIITQDMRINVGRIRATLFYWRRIPTYLDQEGETRNSRMHMMINGLGVTIYNRSWTTNMVVQIKEMIEKGN